MLIQEPNRVIAWVWSKVGHLFGDECYLEVRYRLLMGKKLDLENPRTFSEKLQWLKLYDRKPAYSTMVDKYAVKEYVAGIIGQEYIIPTLGVWDSPEDIDWDRLPERFVLKTTHGGGSNGVVICKDKKSFDKAAAVRILRNNMKGSDWNIQMEWPYKDVPHRIIAEQFVEPSEGSADLSDYKWFCFDGVPKFCQVIQNRSVKETIDIFDTNWKHQDFVGLNPVADNAEIEASKPENLDEQIRIASVLSKGIPFSRIDLYSIGGKVLFGEITFFPMGGYGSFRPSQYDEIIGEMIKLDSVSE